MTRYKTMLNRASIITFGVKYDSLSTSAEKRYIRINLDRFLANDRSRGGYGKPQGRYIFKGGTIPKSWWMKPIKRK